jgi:hypothetical protein
MPLLRSPDIFLVKEGNLFLKEKQLTPDINQSLIFLD